MSRRKFVALLVGSVLLVQLLAWWIVAGESLVEAAARSTRFAFETDRAPQIRRVVDGRREVLPLIVCNELTSRLGVEIAEQIERELEDFNVSVFPESLPPPDVTVAPPRCDGCLIVCARPIRNTPLIGRVEMTFLFGNLGGDGYRSTFVHIFGRWIHWDTAWAWEA
jgi:hypothetical protein